MIFKKALYNLLLIFTLFFSLMFITSGSAAPLESYQLDVAFPNLSFTNPVDFQAYNGITDVFVVEQAGIIKRFNNSPTVDDYTTFLDISDQVYSGGERGLLGLAFHPNYTVNGLFYVYYTVSDPRPNVYCRSIVAQFNMSQSDSLIADPSTQVIIIEINQPYGNHNAGQIGFGSDNYLYIALGDGGSGGDPLNNGQNRATLLGSILRINVDNSTDGKNYSIPVDNPFVGNSEGYREEIYAYGLRNPWRFSFDTDTDRLWVGDVGQSEYEEVDIIERGKNYGWKIMEGNHCYSPSSGCNTTGLELPIIEYSHNIGNSITGGYVYRGKAIPSLVGKYIYGDYGSGRIWALEYDGVNNPRNTELMLSGKAISSFGTDMDNNLYVLHYYGDIYLLTSKITVNKISSNGLPAFLFISVFISIFGIIVLRRK
ncbi:MAG: PQQ-dependent sugar dehydrogenase [Candidatus Hodarchaeota archaeon]